MDASLLDVEYDAVLVGTGMSEAILAGYVYLSVRGAALYLLVRVLTLAVIGPCVHDPVLQCSCARGQESAAPRPGAYVRSAYNHSDRSL